MIIASKEGEFMSKYIDISNQILKRILDKEFLIGEKLPSINELAHVHQCSKGTIIKAYDELISRNIIYAIAKSGYYVADDYYRHEINTTQYDLSTGNPLLNALSLVNLKSTMNIGLDMYSAYSLEIDLPGSKSLINQLQTYLETQNIYTKKENIFLSLGVTQVMSILCQLPFPNKKEIILIEAPTYSFTVEQLKTCGANVMSIKRDQNGIDMHELESIFKYYPIKFFYVITRNHNPLGTYLPNEQRKKIIELAQKYDVYLVENDYFSESFYIPRFDSLYYLSNGKNCIYLKSYTKILPHIRIGFVLVTDELLSIYQKGMQQNYYHSYYMPNLLSQAVLETTLSNHIIDVMGRSISDELKYKIKIYNSHTQQWDKNILQALPIESGVYGVILVHKSINLSQFIKSLKDKHVLVKSTLSSYYHQNYFNHSIRISLARIDAKLIPEALNIIYQRARALLD